MARKMRYGVAMVLMAVYLLGIGGTALSSLLCPCVELHRHSATCCHDHGHTHTDLHPLAAAHDADYSAPCCDDRHSNRLALYTATDDEQRGVKISMRELPPMLHAEQFAMGIACTAFESKHSEARQLPLRHGEARLRALRAPPVKA